jgi:CrcB protein
MIGVLGGFTTFSTFAFETLAFAHGSDTARAFANIGLQVFLGLGAAWLGYTAAAVR